MSYKNYIRVHARLPWYSRFAYLDAPEYLADAVFMNAKIPVRFCKGEFGKEDSPFVIVHCRLRRKYEADFLQCLETLENKMLLCGYTDYGDECRIFADIDKGGNKGQ